METQLEAQSLIPEELGDVLTLQTRNFMDALHCVKSNVEQYPGLRLDVPTDLSRHEKKCLKALPRAFALNKTLQKLELRNAEIFDILIAKALGAGIKKDNVTCIEFWNCERVCSKRLLETMSQGLRERSAAFQLVLNKCSAHFSKPLIEASYLKCFSLEVSSMYCSLVAHPLKQLLKGNLYYISLKGLTGLKEKNFIQLGRCLSPNLNKLVLGTFVPPSALKRLHGFLEAILESRRTSLFEILDLGRAEVSEKLCFSYFNLLRSDVIAEFRLRVERYDLKAVQKSICSTISNTRKLMHLSPGTSLRSETEFKAFKLQNWGYEYTPPFEVNPTIA